MRSNDSIERLTKESRRNFPWKKILEEFITSEMRIIGYPRHLVSQVPGTYFDQTKMKKVEWMALADATSILSGGCHIVSWDDGMSHNLLCVNALTLFADEKLLAPGTDAYADIDLIVAKGGESLKQVKDCVKYCKKYSFGASAIQSSKTYRPSPDIDSDGDKTTTPPAPHDDDQANIIEDPTPRPRKHTINIAMPAQTRERGSSFDTHTPLKSPLFQYEPDNAYAIGFNREQQEAPLPTQRRHTAVYKHGADSRDHNMWKENTSPRQYDDYGIETGGYEVTKASHTLYKGMEGRYRMPLSPEDNSGSHRWRSSPPEGYALAPDGYFEPHSRCLVRPPPPQPHYVQMSDSYAFPNTMQAPNTLPMNLGGAKPSRNLHEHLIAESQDRPFVYRGDLNRHSRSGVNPKGFLKVAHLAKPPSSRSLGMMQKQTKPQRVLPVGSSTRFENAVAGSSKPSRK